MKRWLLAVSVGFAGLCGAGAARAELDTGVHASAQVFDDAGFEQPKSKGLRFELDQIDRKCEFEEFSREGPAPSAVIACEAAVARLLRHGSKAIGPILAAVDRESTSWGARFRLYNILARTKDTRVVEPLIRGMARITTRKLENRVVEIDLMHAALLELTHAPIGERVPWDRSPQMSMRRRNIDVVIDWRLWLEEHRGMSHDELVAQRMAEELSRVDDASPERAYRAVVYLLNHNHPAGVAAAKKLAVRADIPKSGRSELDLSIERAQGVELEAPRKRMSQAVRPVVMPVAPSPKPKRIAPASTPAPASAPPKRKPSALTVRS